MTKKLPTFALGDRIAYAASFLKNIGASTGAIPQRRGVFLRVETSMGSPNFCRVRWDDEAASLPGLAEQYGEDYAEDVRAKGSLVNLTSIAKVRSARFALNDL
jgi:hypothetical protein